MKMTFGRKFLAMVLGIICIMTLMLVGMLKVSPSPVDGKVMIIAIIMIVTIVFMYVGGNVWKSWTRSKYFHPELLNSDQK